MGKNFYSKYRLEALRRHVERKENEERSQDERKVLGLNQDQKIRKYVRRKLEDYIEEGKSKEKAIDLVMQEKGIAQHFSYYAKNGIDIRKIFMEWIEQTEKDHIGEKER